MKCVSGYANAIFFSLCLKRRTQWNANKWFTAIKIAWNESYKLFFFQSSCCLRWWSSQLYAINKWECFQLVSKKSQKRMCIKRKQPIVKPILLCEFNDPFKQLRCQMISVLGFYSGETKKNYNYEIIMLRCYSHWLLQ